LAKGKHALLEECDECEISDLYSDLVEQEEPLCSVHCWEPILTQVARFTSSVHFEMKNEYWCFLGRTNLSRQVPDSS